MLEVPRRRHDDDHTLLDHLEALGRDLAATRMQLAELSFDDVSAQEIPLATSELAAIVTQTEGAADSILDGCETLDRLGRSLATGDRPSMQETASAVFAVTTRIYAACGFQDLTGQRVAKVVTALQVIETRIADLTKALGGRARLADATGTRTGLVLRGPQSPGIALTQTEVDRLLREAA